MNPKDYGLQICIMQSGFVYVGLVSVENGWITIENARNIRTWGTTNGLGELRNGPTKNTKLDEAGTVIAPMHSLNHFIKCVSGWETIYKDQ